MCSTAMRAMVFVLACTSFVLAVADKENPVNEQGLLHSNSMDDVHISTVVISFAVSSGLTYTVIGFDPITAMAISGIYASLDWAAQAGTGRSLMELVWHGAETAAAVVALNQAVENTNPSLNATRSAWNVLRYATSLSDYCDTRRFFQQWRSDGSFSLENLPSWLPHWQSWMMSNSATALAVPNSPDRSGFAVFINNVTNEILGHVAILLFDMSMYFWVLCTVLGIIICLMMPLAKVAKWLAMKIFVFVLNKTVPFFIGIVIVHAWWSNQPYWKSCVHLVVTFTPNVATAFFVTPVTWVIKQIPLLSWALDSSRVKYLYGCCIVISSCAFLKKTNMFSRVFKRAEINEARRTLRRLYLQFVGNNTEDRWNALLQFLQRNKHLLTKAEVRMWTDQLNGRTVPSKYLPTW